MHLTVIIGAVHEKENGVGCGIRISRSYQHTYPTSYTTVKTRVYSSWRSTRRKLIKRLWNLKLEITNNISSAVAVQIKWEPLSRLRYKLKECEHQNIAITQKGLDTDINLNNNKPIIPAIIIYALLVIKGMSYLMLPKPCPQDILLNFHL